MHIVLLVVKENLLKHQLQKLEIWYMTDQYVVLENIPFSTKGFLILLMSAFFLTNQRLLAKIMHSLKAIM